MQVWWAPASPRVTGAHLRLTVSFVEHLLCARRYVRPCKADTESQAVSFLRGWNTGLAGLWGAAESDPQPVGLSQGGCVALALCTGAPSMGWACSVQPSSSRLCGPVVFGLDMRGLVGLAVSPSYGTREHRMPPGKASP